MKRHKSTLEEHLFYFDPDSTPIEIPEQLNNPFSLKIPEIAKKAAELFQEFIEKEVNYWDHDFSSQKGKMFGVLVIQLKDLSYAFIGTVSGKLQGSVGCNKFIPSVFDDSADDFFINKGMSELTKIGQQINASTNLSESTILIAERKQKSIRLQQQLFSHYQFFNIHGETSSVLQIFKDANLGNPPSAVGECAAPKLLHYAFKNKLKPIALAEFWWGNSIKNEERKHLHFYPACTNKCRPILAYMLDDKDIYNQANCK